MKITVKERSRLSTITFQAFFVWEVRTVVKIRPEQKFRLSNLAHNHKWTMRPTKDGVQTLSKIIWPGTRVCGHRIDLRSLWEGNRCEFTQLQNHNLLQQTHSQKMSKRLVKCQRSLPILRDELRRPFRTTEEKGIGRVEKPHGTRGYNGSHHTSE